MVENEYMQRINQAINYIYQHMNENITAEEVADVCCFSKYHFNRIFKSVVNENIYSFIKRLKLESAAHKLRTNKIKSITSIALEAGYSPSNFAVAFKEYFDISASEYRKSINIPLRDSFLSAIHHIDSLKKKDIFFNEVCKKVTIKKLDGMLLWYRRYIGNYKNLEGAWKAFCDEAVEKHRGHQEPLFIGISYNDPLVTDENRCIYDLCVDVEETHELSELQMHKVEEGYYACYDFFDKLENLTKAFNEMFALWFPHSGYDIDNRFCLEVYRSSMDEERKMHIEICFPIVKE